MLKVAPLKAVLARVNARALLVSAGSYLKENPTELVVAMKNAVGLRMGLPLAAFRRLLLELPEGKAPRDVVIESVPPGIRVVASLELMKTPVRADVTVFVEAINCAADELRIELRLANLSLTVLDNGVETPVAALLKSGALDLSKPGNLVAYMPKRPKILTDAKDDRVVLDLLKHPALSKATARRLVGLVTPLIGVRSIGTEEDRLQVAFSPLPQGLGEALSRVREQL